MNLKPSLREKKRYIAYELVSDHRIRKDMGRIIERNVKRILGLFDGAEAGVISVKYNAERKRGILRMNNKYVNKVKVALMLLNAPELGLDEDFEVRTLLVSGAMSKVEHFAS